MEPVETTAVRRADSGQLAGVLAGAEIDSQIATAKRYPRDISTFKARLMDIACTDPQIAASCFYVLPRYGKDEQGTRVKSFIEGPSVRLAELALGQWGNVMAQGDVSHADDHYVYAVGMARDMERNIAVRTTVRRRITDRNGRRYNDDMIAVTANAAVSIALRNAIFKVVPAAYIQPVFQACKEVAAGKAANLEEARQSALDYLGNMGVTEGQVLAALRRKTVADITKGDIIALRGFCTAIRDGDAEIETIFPQTPQNGPQSTNAETDVIPGPAEDQQPGPKQRRKQKKTTKPADSQPVSIFGE